MKIPKQIAEFYTQCMNCPVSKKLCKKAWKNFRKGIVPRAFDVCRNRYPKILVVAKNPGHPLKAFQEQQYYAGKSGKKLFQSHLRFRKEFTDKIMPQTDRSLIFHKNRNRYLRYFLGHSKKIEPYDEYKNRGMQAGRLSDGYEKIMESVALTNLFKCSTKNETDVLSAEDVSTCFHSYFLKELILLKPKVILAMGNEVEDNIKKLGKNKKLPPIVKIRHPSYFYGRDIEPKKLYKIKERLLRFI